MQSTSEVSERAEQWGRLWGSRATDWDMTEAQQVPTYEAALDRIGIGSGQKVLDLGCGTGMFLRLAADRGAETFGLDASEALLELAGERAPEADLRLGDMEALPYEDDSFDVVTGFSSFFFAVDMVAALREAGRVAKPGAPVVIQVWGRHERCDLEAMKEIMRPLLPPRPDGAPLQPELWKPGALEEMAAAAGLEAGESFDLSWAYEYPDSATLGRAMMAPAGLAAMVGPDREDEVRAAIVDGLAPFRNADGAYLLDNEFHYLIAAA